MNRRGLGVGAGILAALLNGGCVTHVFTCNYLNDSNKNGMIDGTHEIVGFNRTEFNQGEIVTFGCHFVGYPYSKIDFQIRDEVQQVNETDRVAGADAYKWYGFKATGPGAVEAKWYLNGKFIGGSRVNIR